MSFGKAVVTVGCVYELVALYSPLPTITALVTRPRRHPYSWCVFFAWLALTAHHFRPQTAHM